VSCLRIKRDAACMACRLAAREQACATLDIVPRSSSYCKQGTLRYSVRIIVGLKMTACSGNIQILNWLVVQDPLSVAIRVESEGSFGVYVIHRSIQSCEAY